MELGEAIAWYRKNRGLTVEELSRLSGVPVEHIEGFESSELASSIQERLAIATVLDVTLGDLYMMQGDDC